MVRLFVSVVPVPPRLRSVTCFFRVLTGQLQFAAVNRGDVSGLAALLARASADDVHVVDSDGCSLLHAAVAVGDTATSGKLVREAVCYCDSTASLSHASRALGGGGRLAVGRRRQSSSVEVPSPHCVPAYFPLCLQVVLLLQAGCAVNQQVCHPRALCQPCRLYLCCCLCVSLCVRVLRLESCTGPALPHAAAARTRGRQRPRSIHTAADI